MTPTWLEHNREKFDPQAAAIVAGADPLFQLPCQLWGNHPHPADVVGQSLEWWRANPKRGRGIELEWATVRSVGLGIRGGYMAPDPLALADGLIRGKIDMSKDADILRPVAAKYREAGLLPSLVYINDENSPGPDGKQESADRRWACIKAVIGKGPRLRAQIGPTIAAYRGEWPDFDTQRDDNGRCACEWGAWIKAQVGKATVKMLADVGLLAPDTKVCLSFMGDFSPRVMLNVDRRAVYRPLPTRCMSNWQLGAQTWEALANVAMFRAGCTRWLPTFEATHPAEWFERLLLVGTDPAYGCMAFCGDRELSSADHLAPVIAKYKGLSNAG